MKILKKILLISSLLLCIYSITFASNTNFPTVTTYKYINDYTGTISKDYINKIISIGKELENKTSAQCVIVVIDSTDNIDISQYANKLFRTWGIGSSENNNGLLILLALDDHNWRVEVGKGLEGTIPDILTNEIMTNYGKPYFTNSDYNNGLLNCYYEFSSIIANEYNVKLTSIENINISHDDYSTNKSNSTNSSLNVIGYILVLILLDVIFNKARISRTLIQIIAISGYNHRKGPRGGGHGGFGGGNNGNGGFGGGSSNGGGSSGSW